MRPWTLVRGALLALLLVGACGAMCAGAAYLVVGAGWGKLGGLALLAGGFRAAILFLDQIWERPPQFSKRPWDRPWEREDGG